MSFFHLIEKNVSSFSLNFFVVFPGRDKRPIKSLVVGRPILLALEDIDGGPSFLEKALRFLEKYGKLWSPNTYVMHLRFVSLFILPYI